MDHEGKNGEASLLHDLWRLNTRNPKSPTLHFLKRTFGRLKDGHFWQVAGIKKEEIVFANRESEREKNQGFLSTQLMRKEKKERPWKSKLKGFQVSDQQNLSWNSTKGVCFNSWLLLHLLVFACLFYWPQCRSEEILFTFNKVLSIHSV